MCRKRIWNFKICAQNNKVSGRGLTENSQDQNFSLVTIRKMSFCFNWNFRINTLQIGIDNNYKDICGGSMFSERVGNELWGNSCHQIFSLYSEITFNFLQILWRSTTILWNLRKFSQQPSTLCLARFFVFIFIYYTFFTLVEIFIKRLFISLKIIERKIWPWEFS